MNAIEATFTNMRNGFLAGLGAVLITASFGFIVGLVTLSQGHPISMDFESNVMGLIGIVVFSIVFWGLFTGFVGAAIGIFSGLLTRLWPFFRRSRRALVIALVLSAWAMGGQAPGLPFRNAFLTLGENVAADSILCVYALATLGMAYYWSGHVAAKPDADPE